MELVRKLSTKKTANGNYVSWGVFHCPKCGQEVERPLSNGKGALTCGCTTDKAKTKYNLYLQEAWDNGGLVFVKDLGGGRVECQCPLCFGIFQTWKKRLNTQKSCGCGRFGPIKELGYIMRKKLDSPSNCECGKEIATGEYAFGVKLSTGWIFVCGDCFAEPETRREMGRGYIREVAAQKARLVKKYKNSPVWGKQLVSKTIKRHMNKIRAGRLRHQKWLKELGKAVEE